METKSSYLKFYRDYKSRRKNLEVLKRKFDIFIWIKNIFNLDKMYPESQYMFMEMSNTTRIQTL